MTKKAKSKEKKKSKIRLRVLIIKFFQIVGTHLNLSVMN